MAILVWAATGLILALLVSIWFNSDWALNITAGLVGSLLGGGLMAYFNRGNLGTWDALTDARWDNFWVSLASGAALLGLVQLLLAGNRRQNVQH